MKIAIASGKGGTGKTLVSTNLFYTLMQQDYEVTLVDCGAEEPNAQAFFPGFRIKSKRITQQVPVINTDLCTYCGKCYDYCNYNAIFFLRTRKTIHVMEELCHGCGACSIACTKGAITEKEDELGTVNTYSISKFSKIIESRMKVGVYTPVNVIKAAIKEAGQCPVVILDSPPGTSCPFIQTVSQADFVILVTEPTPFGLSDLKQSVDTLKTLSKKYGVIINKAGLGNRDVYNYLETEKIALLMEIPFDKEVASIYSKGEIYSIFNRDWQKKFKEMVDKIINNNGDSRN